MVATVKLDGSCPAGSPQFTVPGVVFMPRTATGSTTSLSYTSLPFGTLNLVWVPPTTTTGLTSNPPSAGGNAMSFSYNSATGVITFTWDTSGAAVGSLMKE